MSTLNDVMKLPGALAAFAFRGSGELIDHQTTDPATFSPDMLDLLAHMCAANTSIAAMQARGWEKASAMNGFYPVHECTLFGLDWSVVVSGVSREAQKVEGKDLLPPFTGVVVNNTDADFEATFAALERVGGGT